MHDEQQDARTGTGTGTGSDTAPRGCALVTGSARGIGKAIARTLAQDGYDIVVNYTSEARAEEAEAFSAELESSTGVASVALRADVSDYDQAEALVKAAEERFGFVEVLVNNAGITRDTLLLRMKPEQFTDVVDVNLVGTFNCTKLVSGKMLKARRGRIVSLASVVGIAGNVGQANYAASKAGVIGFSKSVAREYARRGITVNVVAPGYIQTDMTAAMSDKASEAVLTQIPQGRQGLPQDVAHAVSFLVSDKASYITGQVLSVDGGMAM